MKKFTVLGDGADYGHIAAHVVAVDKETALSVARVIYQGRDCDWKMFSGHLVDVEDAGTYETPDQFCKRCMTELHDLKPKTMRKAEFLTAISDYLHWYQDNFDKIKLFLADAPKVVHDAPPPVPDYPIMQEHDWDTDGSPRMQPWRPPFGGPRQDPLGLRTWELEPLKEILVELKEPEVHIESEAPTRPRHYWMVGRGGTAVGIQIRKDGEIVTNRYQTIAECLRAFAADHPNEDLMIFGDNDIYVWFKMNDPDGFKLSKVTIHVCGRPTVRTEEELVVYVKSLNIYQLFAIAVAVPDPQAALNSFIAMTEEKVRDKSKPAPLIPVMIEPSVKALTAGRMGYRSLTIEEGQDCPYVLTAHYPEGLGTTTEVKVGWFNSLHAALSGSFVNRQERMVVYKGTDTNKVVWLQYNEYHKCPSVHYWDSPSDKTRDESILETHSILQFVRSLEIVRRVAIYCEITKNRDLR